MRLRHAIQRRREKRFEKLVREETLFLSRQFTAAELAEADEFRMMVAEWGVDLFWPFNEYELWKGTTRIAVRRTSY